jgi:hypothetical protein
MHAHSRMLQQEQLWQHEHPEQQLKTTPRSQARTAVASARLPLTGTGTGGRVSTRYLYTTLDFRLDSAWAATLPHMHTQTTTRMSTAVTTTRSQRILEKCVEGGVHTNTPCLNVPPATP